MPARDTSARGRRARRVLLAVTSLGLVAALAVAGSLLLFSGGDGPAGAADDGDSGTPAPSEAGTTAAGEPSATPTDPATDPAGDAPSPTASRSPRDRPPRPTAPKEEAAAPYRCWDGSGAADATGCDLPTGYRGLRWVFPGASESVCRPAPQRNRLASIECRFTTPSGGVVAVHYTEWAEWSDGHRHYERLEVRNESRWRGMLRWNVAAASPSPPFKTALMYPDAPWSVTVYGYTIADRNEVLDQLEWRSGDLRGTDRR